VKSLRKTRLLVLRFILTDYCRIPAPPFKMKREAGFVRSLLIKCFLSKILTYNAQFNFCCHCLGPVFRQAAPSIRSPFGFADRSRFPPSSGPLTVPSFSVETPESNFQRSGALTCFRATKNSTRPDIRNQGRRASLFQVLRIRTRSVCQDKVEST
jgi:hypothetical protein